MSASNRWSRGRELWQSVPLASYVIFIAGIFFMFLPVGLLGDISGLGSEPPRRLLVEMLVSGGLAVAYVLGARRPKWLFAVIAIHILVVTEFERFLPARTAALAGEALQRRLRNDTNIVVVALTASFILLSHFVRREGSRYIRAHTEIALARDIHRLLVPPITRRIGLFEFQGISVPSGDVGGDLIDVVESDGHWIGYAADVSGHGVGAGLLMGMVKSAARTQLQAPQPIDRLLNSLNLILFDLKKPGMFVTFAGIQFDGGLELQFSVAGNLPILHYRRATSMLDELTIRQVPLAMFDGRSFSASRIACEPGDLFVILTDGLTEVFDANDREFGLDRVKMLVREHAAAPLHDLQEVVLAAARAHGRQLDDQTLLLIRAAGPLPAE
jgi:serine phosphatase RsbU (regulator of sigma subunit)